MSISTGHGRSHRIAVALSGGVDSSVAFLLLKEAGHEVFGLTMRHLCEETAGVWVGSCCSRAAVAAAGRLCAAHGAAHHVMELEQEFRDAVLRPSAAAWMRGETPNPCVTCNEAMKFGILLRRARELGAEFLATGHYARCEEGRLFRAVDRARDQSYFLYRLGVETLRHVIFPLGVLTKDRVRAIAAEHGIEAKDARDSMDICFAPNGDFTDFFRTHAPEALEPGEILDEAGNLLGRHGGLGRVTIGQRKGFGVKAGERLYVTRIDPDRRCVTLGAAPKTDRLTMCDCVFRDVLPSSRRILARIRSQHEGAPARIEPRGDERTDVIFDEPQFAVTAGQSCVLYDGDEVLGGGIIERSS